MREIPYCDYSLNLQLMERHGNEFMEGKVYLIGAGPGDAGLLTCRAEAVLKKAEVVLYDALISLEILAMLPKAAEKINVGKRAGNHAMTQKEINSLLLEKAQEGKRVVRLKGGDPFVFGRGGEELQLLAQQGIAFEIVPGVTSAVAVPAYAGIPVTHREYASSFHIITGHAKDSVGTDSKEEIPFKALAQLNATLVFLMGAASLRFICQGLLLAGMSPDTPAAVISRGTTAAQETLVSTLKALPEMAAEQKMHTPAIIVVGEVCTFSESFSWAEKRPLGRICVMVTRPQRQALALAERLRDQGAHVVEMPVIRTELLTDNRFLRSFLERLQNGDFCGRKLWLAFTSPSGVSLFFEQLRRWKYDLRSLFTQSFSIAAIGAGTSRELQRYGLFADLIPEEYSAAALGEALAKQLLKEQSKLVILRAKEGSPDLIQPLIQAQIDFEDLALYETVYEKQDFLAQKVQQAVQAGELPFITFTSASTVSSFVEAVDYALWDADARKGFAAVCIGEKTAQAAENAGMRILTAKEATMDSMVEAIIEAV